MWDFDYYVNETKHNDGKTEPSPTILQQIEDGFAIVFLFLRRIRGASVFVVTHFVFIVSVQSVCFAHHSAARQCEQALIALALANGCFIRAFFTAHWCGVLN
jgi:hypothetical protein